MSEKQREYGQEFGRARATHRANAEWVKCDDVILTDGVCTIRLVKRNGYGRRRYAVERYGSKMHQGLFETLAGAEALFRRLGGVIR